MRSSRGKLIMPSVAYLYMTAWEEIYIFDDNHSPYCSEILMYKHFIDDIFFLFLETDFKLFTLYSN